jgi:hypothetical protein
MVNGDRKFGGEVFLLLIGSGLAKQKRLDFVKELQLALFALQDVHSLPSITRFYLLTLMS